MNPCTVWDLHTHLIGRRVLVFDRLDSTGNLAASLANDPANDGVVVLAQEQTAGRGQHGRSWTCPAGTGVLMSVLLFPPPQLRRPALLTAWAAVSVCETALQVANVQAKIKWPNDVLIHGRKVCGILIESRPLFDAGLCVVAGIGLNVSQTPEMLAQDELTEATSLFASTGRDLSWAETARVLVRQLDQEYERLCGGDVATLESSWKWRVGLLGKQVAAECANGTHTGRLLEMGWDGLELELNDHQRLRLAPETVRHLRTA